jgi:hypothetical protein
MCGHGKIRDGARDPNNDMSPGWVNGKREEFSSIGMMMEHWEEMERREEEERDRLSNQKEDTRRISSKRIQELMENFEEGGGEQRIAEVATWTN